MAPLDIPASAGHVVENLCYLLTGIGFGFVLERAGFGNSKKLAAQFYFREMRVLKVMFTALMTAMLLIFWSDALGVLDYRALYVNPAYLGPGVLGGLIFGIGFVVGGYCPGTALVSMATLKLDGLFFVLGMMVGMLIFGETVHRFQVFFDTSGAYGEVTVQGWLGIPAGAAAFAVVVMALLAFWGAEKAETHFRDKPTGGEV